MTYNNEEFSWVTERYINDELNTVYRNNNDPSKCILIIGDKITDVNIREWRLL